MKLLADQLFWGLLDTGDPQKDRDCSSMVTKISTGNFPPFVAIKS